MNARPRRAGNTDPGAAVAAIWTRYRDPALASVTALEDAVAALIEDRLPEATRRAAERDAHRLAGSAGTFGFPRASEAARQLEGLFTGTGPISPARILLAADEVAALRDAFDAGPSPAPGTEPPGYKTTPRLLVAVSQDRRREQIAAAAAAHGFRAIEVSDPDRIPTMRRRPAAALVDLGFPDGGGIRMIEHLALADPPVPVLALTPARTSCDRLEAARAGARGFLAAAAPPEELFDAVEGMLNRTRTAGTVLVVDDDPAVLAAVGAALGTAGLRTVGLADPARFWTALEDEQPDLVILDLDMPQVSGEELCRVVRADARWARLPVLFLTAHCDQATTGALFAAGADDFVAKPFSGPDLLARVQNRLERTRLLQASVETDPLTGRGNRRRAEPDLQLQLSLAERHRQPFSPAVLGLDSFQHPTDQQGRAMHRARRTGRVHPADASGSVSGHNVDVVVVEDDAALTELLAHALTTRGYRFHCLTDGQAAADQLARSAPALRARVVLLDVDLPVLNGFGVLRQMAAAGTLSGTRVIMLTARSSEREVIEALELGAFDHVAKPFSVPVLMQRIHRALGT